MEESAKLMYPFSGAFYLLFDVGEFCFAKGNQFGQSGKALTYQQGEKVCRHSVAGNKEKQKADFKT